jgi:hypothetical protein
MKGNRITKRMDSLNEIIPPDDVLWDVLNRVLEIEPVAMTVQGSVFMIVEADSVNVISK